MATLKDPDVEPREHQKEDHSQTEGKTNAMGHLLPPRRGLPVFVAEELFGQHISPKGR